MPNTHLELDFDEVLILPKISDVTSRDSVSLKTKLGGLTLDIPIICSPMKWISTPELIIKLGKLGGIGILHRFYNDRSERYRDIDIIASSGVRFGVAVGLNDDWKQILTFLPDILCIDIANGYLTSLHSKVREIRDFLRESNIKSVQIMAGNVVDFVGARELDSCGASIVRVGIGTGNLCTTRKNTGVGRPQITAISDTSQSDVSIVSDGGIKNSGDIVKALAAGADAVMIGTLFSQAFESGHDGTISGMASRELQENFYGYTKSVEGISQTAEKSISLDELVSEWVYNIKSGCTYVGAKNLDELRTNAKFVVTLV